MEKQTQWWCSTRYRKWDVTELSTYVILQWATRNPRFPFTLCVAAPLTQSSWPAAYNGKWPERAIIDHMYNAALYSGGLRRWCCRPTFTSCPLQQHTAKMEVTDGIRALTDLHIMCYLFIFCIMFAWCHYYLCKTRTWMLPSIRSATDWCFTHFVPGSLVQCWHWPMCIHWEANHKNIL